MPYMRAWFRETERKNDERHRNREEEQIVSEGRRGVHRLTSCSLPPPSLFHSQMQRGSAALMTFSEEPAHRGPSPSDTRGLPRHSGAGVGEREREGGERGREGGREGVSVCVITKEIPLNFLPLTNHH